MLQNLKTFIFIGRSGCGKGTQISKLQGYLQGKGKENVPIFVVETGNRFRAFIQGDSYSSDLSRNIMKTGARQPDFLAVWMWSVALVENITGAEHVIFDGTPRSLAEAKSLDSALSFYNREEVYVVHINVSREEAKRRLLERGRPDDRDPAEVDKRLNWFDTDVVPAIEYYRNHDRYTFIELDGEASVETVFENLLTKLHEA